METFYKKLLNTTIYISARHFFKACQKSKTDKLKLKEKIPKDFGKEDEHKHKLLETKISLDGKEKTHYLDDIPQELLRTRTARIFQPPKNAMQSATYNTKHWVVGFDTKERWENQNMGWCSSGDPISNVHIEFTTVEDAIKYCEKNGWKWTITTRALKKKSERRRTYAQNFLDKRCRVSTK